MQKYDFELVQEENIAEIFGLARLWRHKVTGAELLSVTNNDENKCFGVSLRTPPKDDTGIAHILEHSVLCGSEKYPVKELFAELMKGSLQTFLNAFTFPDKTCYPVASVNLQDFYNLIDVYLDAVFHPKINEDTLRQEGFRIEAQGLDKEKWSFQGVVYNEMKGVYSSPDSVLMEASQQALFPDHLYGLDSGGNPKHIPDLTYAQFIDFHNKYYHPSNARFFFWGDDDDDARLKFLSEFLVAYDKIELDSQIPLMPKLTSPRHIEVSYPCENIEDNQKNAHATVSWLLCETAHSKEIFELEMLCRILLGLPGSPLRRALLESGLGEDLTGAGLESDLRQAYFSIGLRSMQADKVNELELLIFDTLADLVQTGLDKNDIEAAVNSIEFALRENNSGSFPRGLSAMLRSLSTWLYDGEALSNLAWEKDLAEIKAKIASGDQLFEKLIQKYFLDNEHRAVVVLLPDANLAAQKTAEERARLEKITKDLNEDQSTKLVEQSQKLLAMQNAPDSPEALARIPSLKVEDLAKKNTLLPIDVDKSGAFIAHELDCMGIVYTNLLFEMRSLPDELLALVPLYARALTEMGTKKHDFVQLGQMIAAKTGGIGASPSLHKHLVDPKPMAKLCFGGKATADKLEAMLDIFDEILNDIDFDDQERFLLMVLEEKARLEQSLVPSGHSYVSLRLEASYSLVDNIEERQDGVSYLFYLRDLVNQVQNDWSIVYKNLQTIHELVISQDKLIVDLACDAKYRQASQSKIMQFVQKLPVKKNKAEKWTMQDFAKNEALITPAEVNYVGLAMNIFEQGYKFNGSALVIFRHLRMSYLWEKVRVQGGAYGVFVRFSRVSGVTKLLSYRDPNLAKTLEVYHNLPKYLEQIKMSERDLARAVVGAISDFDAYMLPQVKASAALWRYLSGESDENRQIIRDELLSTKLSDFKALAPYLDSALKDTHACALGSKALKIYAQENNWHSLLLNS